MRRLSVILVAAATLAGCSGAQEHALLFEFFSASRLRDNTALAQLAIVRFEPTRVIEPRTPTGGAFGARLNSVESSVTPPVVSVDTLTTCAPVTVEFTMFPIVIDMPLAPVFPGFGVLFVAPGLLRLIVSVLPEAVSVRLVVVARMFV